MRSQSSSSACKTGFSLSHFGLTDPKEGKAQGNQEEREMGDDQVQSKAGSGMRLMTTSSTVKVVRCVCSGETQVHRVFGLHLL